jgi:hypothetical protein
MYPVALSLASQASVTSAENDKWGNMSKDSIIRQSLNNKGKWHFLIPGRQNFPFLFVNNPGLPSN